VTTSRRRSFPRVLAAAAAVLTLSLAPALPAHAAPVVSEVPGGFLVSSLVEYQGLLYGGSEAGLQSFDGTTFATIPGAPESPRDFVEYLGDLWFVGGDLTGATPTLWRFDGTTPTQVEPLARNPVLVGGLLYVELGDGVGGWVLASTDGTTMTPTPASPTDVSSLAAGPNGEVVYTSGSPRMLWTFDGTATHAQVMHAGAPLDVYGTMSLPGALLFGAQENAGDDDTAYMWDGAVFTKLGASGGGAIDPGCFVLDSGVLFYSANDGARRMFSATPGVAASEVATTPNAPQGCPRYIATDGTFYLQALGVGGGDPTLHTWDGTTLTELDTVGDFPTDFVEYNGKLYFTAQPISETPALFVLEDVTTTPTGPLLPPTGGEVSPALLVVAGALVLGGVGILAVRGVRRRA
jgi:hypothetical protein